MKKSILLVAVMSAMIFTSCKENASDKVNTENIEMAAERDAQAAKFPVITFEETVHDFGTIIQGTQVQHRFKFTNTGNAPLVIVDATSSCGCTVPEKPTGAIAPGETGELLVKFNGSGANQVSKTVTITANTRNGKEQIRIKAFVTPKNTTSPLKVGS